LLFAYERIGQSQDSLSVGTRNESPL